MYSGIVSNWIILFLYHIIFSPSPIDLQAAFRHVAGKAHSPSLRVLWLHPVWSSTAQHPSDHPSHTPPGQHISLPLGCFQVSWDSTFDLLCCIFVLHVCGFPIKGVVRKIIYLTSYPWPDCLTTLTARRARCCLVHTPLSATWLKSISITS